MVQVVLMIVLVAVDLMVKVVNLAEMVVYLVVAEEDEKTIPLVLVELVVQVE